jgi:antitoxin component of MazEF toxin-antitoxin module
MKNEKRKAMRKIRQVGNSLGVLLPKQMLDGWLASNTIVRVIRLGSYIVLTPKDAECPLTEKKVQDTINEVGLASSG